MARSIGGTDIVRKYRGYRQCQEVSGVPTMSGSIGGTDNVRKYRGYRQCQEVSGVPTMAGSIGVPKMTFLTH